MEHISVFIDFDARYNFYYALHKIVFMVKSRNREMKNLSRILTVILFCVPGIPCMAGPVATTSGSNLTAYNPSTAYNNQWATVSNGRYDNDVSAKVDFGNCNAVVLRCAQPKCSGGGCTDYNVAGQIVSGCVKSNAKCKQYGDDLINYMTAQLVANSNAKINEQQMALEQAKIQAEAQAAAASNAQNEQMMAQMQNQMAQMQQQMAQQQEESNRQLQEALAQQAAQSAAALEDMRSAATEASKETEAGITSYQQEAIERGISADVLERQKITGQIMTEIENADLKLKEVRTAMQNSFDYAGCDARGNNCNAPKRIKKWRELARGFSEPYTDTLQDIYTALMTAQTVGVDLSQIYAMLSNSCSQWGQYLCEKGSVKYGDKGPESCDSTVVDTGCYAECLGEISAKSNVQTDMGVVLPNQIKTKIEVPALKGSFGTKSSFGGLSSIVIGEAYADNSVYNVLDSVCRKRCPGKCKPCTFIKMLTENDEVYEGWVNLTTDTQTNGTVVWCSSQMLQNSTLFSSLLKRQNDKMLVPMEQLEKWLDQVEPSTAKKGECDSEDTKMGRCYCAVDDNVNILEKAVSKKSVSNISGSKGLCVNSLGPDSKTDASGECTYINPIFAICDTHPYNANKTSLESGGTINTSEQERMNEIISLKITVISQQMYKQYEYLRATLQRLKIQLEKSVLAANLEAAGAKDDNGSSSSGGLLGGGKDSDKTIHLAGAENCANKMSSESVYSCIQGNVSLIISSASSNANKACKQLIETIDAANTWGIKVDNEDVCKNIGKGTCDKKNIIPCAQKLNVKVAQEKEKKAEKQQYRGYGYQN